MSENEPSPTSVTGRREPPPFRRVTVADKEMLGPHMIRVVFEGDTLGDMPVPDPAASVRLLVPSPGAGLEIPKWAGNEFLLSDGTRPLLRTFTPRWLVPPQLVIDLVLHHGGAISSWASAAEAGDPAAVSGPGRGYAVADSARDFILAGDETAIPAMSQLIETLPAAARIRVHIVVRDGFGRIEVAAHPQASVVWHESTGAVGSTFVAALGAEDISAETRLWCAGEAAAMHQVRKYLFQELELPRRQATVRGYWKA